MGLPRTTTIGTILDHFGLLDLEVGTARPLMMTPVRMRSCLSSFARQLDASKMLKNCKIDYYNPLRTEAKIRR